MTATLRRWAVLALALGPGGCFFSCNHQLDPKQQCVGVGASGHKPPSSSKPFVWIGTNDSQGHYRPITPNELLPLQHGGQGLTHVWGAAQLYAPDASGDYTFVFQLVDDHGSVAAEQETIGSACGNDLLELSNVTVIFNDYTNSTSSSSSTGSSGGGGSGSASSTSTGFTTSSSSTTSGTSSASSTSSGASTSSASSTGSGSDNCYSYSGQGGAALRSMCTISGVLMVDASPAAGGAKVHAEVPVQWYRQN